MPWRLLATQFTGNEGDPDELPSWVVDAVLRGANVVPKVRVIDTVLTVISINGHRAAHYAEVTSEKCDSINGRQSQQMQIAARNTRALL